MLAVRMLFDHLVTALCTADIGAPPQGINFRIAIPDERVKFLVGHTAELICMAALDLLHIEPHEFAALHFRGDGRAQLTRRPCRVAKALELAHVRFKREDCFGRLTFPEPVQSWGYLRVSN